MPFGEYRDENNANVGDTVSLAAAIYNEDRLPYPPEDLVGVEFDIQRPDKSRVVLTGTVEDDGTGTLLFEDTTQVGEYIAVARFRLLTGETKSTRIDFDISDPFDDKSTPVGQIVDAVWLKIEDCFDSEEGGPWLRDVTKRFFHKRKIPHLIPEALMLINLQPPMTTATLADFTTTSPDGELDTDQAVLVEAVFLEVIRHLMRSYVEQPLPAGAQVVYDDRRDYLERWGTIYQIEHEHFSRVVALWKRQFLNLGASSLLVSSKAGRLIPAPMRTRNVGRGYY